MDLLFGKGGLTSEWRQFGISKRRQPASHKDVFWANSLALSQANRTDNVYLDKR